VSADASLDALDELFAGAQGTLRAIRRNLAFSLAYNLSFAVLALGGSITPLAAAVLMPLSSLTVLAASYASRSFRPTDGIGIKRATGESGGSRSGRSRGP